MDLETHNGFIKKVDIRLDDALEARIFFLGLKPAMPLLGRGNKLTKQLLDPEASFPVEFTLTESRLRKVGRNLIARELDQGNKGLLQETLGLRIGTEISHYLQPDVE